MTLDQLQTKRDELGGGDDTVVRRMKGTHEDANEDKEKARFFLFCSVSIEYNFLFFGYV